MSDLDEGRSPGEAAELVARMAEGGETLAVAESLTGGLLADAFVSVPGASAVFVGGVVSYATRIKAEVLGVSADLLARVGAPDPEVAVAMAVGVRQLLRSTVALATTGVAGPESQDGKPPGTIYVALATSRRTRVSATHVAGTRQQVRVAAVRQALDLLADELGE
ncbi:MAG: CinA family protein [Actinobacteria bacterium]|nr:CinA family protein [Actinomycetota bacterium]